MDDLIVQAVAPFQQEALESLAFRPRGGGQVMRDPIDDVPDQEVGELLDARAALFDERPVRQELPIVVSLMSHVEQMTDVAFDGIQARDARQDAGSRTRPIEAGIALIVKHQLAVVIEQ